MPSISIKLIDLNQRNSLIELTLGGEGGLLDLGSICPPCFLEGGAVGGSGERRRIRGDGGDLLPRGIGDLDGRFVLGGECCILYIFRDASGDR